MAKSHFVELEAAAVQLLAALGDYEEHVTQLVRLWSADADMEHYARVSRQVDGIRDLCGMLPSAGALWATVLISHTELMHSLWRVSQSRDAGLVVGEQLQDHIAVIAALRAKCRRMIASTAGGQSP